jgi:hypothetical protein
VSLKALHVAREPVKVEVRISKQLLYAKNATAFSGITVAGPATLSAPRPELRLQHAGSRIFPQQLHHVAWVETWSSEVETKSWARNNGYSLSNSTAQSGDSRLSLVPVVWRTELFVLAGDHVPQLGY